MILPWPFPKRETPQEKLARIVRETRESYECRRFREKRSAALKRVPTLVLVRSQQISPAPQPQDKGE